MMQMRSPSLLLVPAVLLAGCGALTTETAERRPDLVSARVVAVGPVRVYTAVLVDTAGRVENPMDMAGRYYLQVGPETRVYTRTPAGGLQGSNVSELRPGDAVRAWRTGVELRSAPPQYPVTRVEQTSQ
jgi:hypothetical protein